MSRQFAWLAMTVLLMNASIAHSLAIRDYSIVAGDLGSSAFTRPVMSGDGRTVVGRGPIGSSVVHRWRPDAGTQTMMLPALLDGTSFSVSAISGDGNTAAGTFGNESGSVYSGFVWDLETGATTRIDLPNGFGTTSATAISADGHAVAGIAMLDTLETVAYRWDVATGIQTIRGFQNLSRGIRNVGLSADGSVVIGSSGVDFGSRRGVPFIWDAAQGIRHLGEPAESGFQPGGTPYDVSADGRIVVGDGGDLAFSWKEEGGMRSLDPSGMLLDPNPQSSYEWAFAVSGDGSVIVGEFYGRELSGQEVNGGFVWDEESGMQRLDVLLRASGLVGIDQIRGALAMDVSSDGTKILATAIEQGGGERLMIVTIPEPSSAVALWLGLCLLAVSHRR